MSIPRILLLMGFPGSGKSTFAREFLRSRPWTRISGDDSPHKSKQELLRDGYRELISGRSIIVDQVNLAPFHRKGWLDMARDRECPIFALHIDIAVSDCIGAVFMRKEHPTIAMRGRETEDQYWRRIEGIIASLNQTYSPISGDEMASFDNVTRVSSREQAMELLSRCPREESFSYAHYNLYLCDSVREGRGCAHILCPYYHSGYRFDNVVATPDFQSRLCTQVATWEAYLKMQGVQGDQLAKELCRALRIGDFRSSVLSVRILLETMESMHFDTSILRGMKKYLNWAAHPAHGQKKHIVRHIALEESFSKMENFLLRRWPSMKRFLRENQRGPNNPPQNRRVIEIIEASGGREQGHTQNPISAPTVDAPTAVPARPIQVPRSRPIAEILRERDALASAGTVNKDITRNKRCGVQTARGTPCTSFTPCSFHGTRAIPNLNIGKGKWTQEEEDRMKNARAFCILKQWEKVQELVQTRSRAQCISKWQNICKKEKASARSSEPGNVERAILPRPS